MRRLATILLLVLLASLWLSAAVLAQETPPEGALGACPPDFHFHQMGDQGHDDSGHGPHSHVGNDKDQNGDGWICVKHGGLDDKVHIHMDNSLPLGE